MTARYAQRSVRVPSEEWTAIPEAGVTVMQVSGTAREVHLHTDTVAGLTHLVIPASAGTSWAVKSL